MEHSSGYVFLNKPAGITSFQCLSYIKKRMPGVKVGHTGTLDKFARGMLIAVSGTMTKTASLITSLPKQYKALIEFGKQTDTLDPEGKIISVSDYFPDHTEINHALEQLMGEIEQIPPQFSAVHVNGERAYNLIRNGKKADLKPRKVTIYSNSVLEYRPPFLRLKVKCSKGTYIRSLARDIGKMCGSAAYVKELERTDIGSFTLAECILPEQFEPAIHLKSPSSVLPLIKGVSHIRVLDQYIHSLFSGKSLKDMLFDSNVHKDGLYAVFTKSDDFVAMLERKAGSLSYKFVGSNQ